MEQFEGILNPIFFQEKKEEYIQQLQRENLHSEPYNHTLLSPLCDPDFLRQIHDEVTLNMKANFKETDLFKVFQTSELGAFDEETLEKEMPHLLKLRKVLYSKEFRDFIAKITNCREEFNEILTDRVDCSINAYANSCHLLCHDDVIGTRCVSYIIYFPNPDEEWKKEDGGAVELYPLDPNTVITTTPSDSVNSSNATNQAQGVPAANPTKSLLPIFNSMLIFKVQPGKSYHSVQEVFNKNSPRLSISGWYHASQPPIGSDYSSLKLIMKYGDEQSPVHPIPPTPQKITEELPSSDPFTEEEATFLRQYLATEYLQIKNLKKLKKNFITNSSIHLQQFLRKDFFLKIQTQIITIDYEDTLGKGNPSLDYLIGVKDGWQVIGPAHKRRFLAYQPSEEQASSTADTPLTKVGGLLKKIKEELFTHPAFIKFLSFITTIEDIKGIRSEIRRFRPGLDYTVAHYGIITREPWLDINLCFVNDEKDIEEDVLRKLQQKNSSSENGKKRKKDEKLKLKSLKKRNSKQTRKDDMEEEEEIEKGDSEDGYASDYGELWEDGDVGGFECFIEAENDTDDAEAAEVYRQKKEGEEGNEDDTTLLSLSAYSNSLSVVLRDEGIMKFVKYVSANAPGSRWDVTAEYQIEPLGENEDDDDDDGESASKGEEDNESDENVEDDEV